jgi:hypothetical protein
LAPASPLSRKERRGSDGCLVGIKGGRDTDTIQKNEEGDANI